MITILKRLLQSRSPEPDDADPLSRVDLCFVVDTTASMGPFIDTARHTLLGAMKRLSTQHGIDLRIGLVAYRDHPPQNRSYVTRIHRLTYDQEHMQKVINRLRPLGGGDGPEAVYRGVYDAVTRMPWRPYSNRYLMLIGDAPPHGFAAWYRQIYGVQPRRLRRVVDAWPDGCPSGLDVLSVSAAAEEERVTVFALCLGHWQATRLAFQALATATGGRSAAAKKADDVISEMEALLQKEYAHLAFDREVLRATQQSNPLDVRRLATSLACTEGRVAASLGRLGRRGLLNTRATASNEC